MQSALLADATVVVVAGAPPLEQLAAAELRRYVFLLTGTYPRLSSALPDSGPLLAVGAAARSAAARAGGQDGLDGLGAQEMIVRSVSDGNRPLLLIAGGFPAATQWAAYALLERLGCGFYLGGAASDGEGHGRRGKLLPVGASTGEWEGHTECVPIEPWTRCCTPPSHAEGR